nr:MAG TPA: single-stranded DNA binding protein [Bacteriophage sp.]
MSNEVFDFGGIFDMKSDDFKQKETTQFSNPDFYSPRIDDENVKDNIYQSKLRFLPNVNVAPNGERTNIVVKHVYYVPDPDNPGQKCYIDAPSNEPKAKDIASVAFMMFGYDKSKIYRSDAPAIVKKNAKQLKRNTYHYSLVQVIKDTQHPELEGTVKIFRYGGVIYAKIMQLINGNPALGINPIIPFDPLNGKEFIMVLSKGQNDQGQELNTYMQSRFVDDRSAITIDGREMTDYNEDKQAIFNFLKEKSPDLSQTMFQKMTEDDIERLNRAVRDVLDDDKWFGMAYQACYGKPFTPDAVRESVVSTEEYDDEEIEVEEQVVEEQVVEEPVRKAPRREEPASSTISKFKSLKDEAEKPVPAKKPTDKPSISDMMEDIDDDLDFE